MHRFTRPYNPLHLQLDSKDNPLLGNEPYNGVDAISMRHDICYWDNPMGKHECDNPPSYQHVALNAKTQKSTPKFHVGDKVCITRKKCTLRKDLHPIGQKSCLSLAVWKLLIHQHILSRISLENQFEGAFTSKSCSWVYRKSFVLSVYSGRRKFKYTLSGKVTAMRSIRGYH